MRIAQTTSPPPAHRRATVPHGGLGGEGGGQPGRDDHQVHDQALRPEGLDEERGGQRALEHRDPPGARARDQHEQRHAIHEDDRQRVEIGRVPLVDVPGDLGVARHPDVVGQQPRAVGRDARGEQAAQQGEGERAGVRGLPHAADPCHQPGRRQRPPQLDAEHEQPDQDRPVRVDPCHAQQREREQPAPIGPPLGQHQQLHRQPDEREVQPPVAHHHACDAQREEQDDGDHPSTPRPQGARVGRRRQQAGRTQDDGVHVVGGGTDRPVEPGQSDLGAPLVGHPAAMRLRVAEGVQAHDGVVAEHPLARGQRPEGVIGEFAPERDRRDVADADGEADQLDRTLRHAARRLGRPRTRRGGAGRRHIACLDGPDARLHLLPPRAGPPTGAPGARYNGHCHLAVAGRLPSSGLLQQLGCSTSAFASAAHSYANWYSHSEIPCGEKPTSRIWPG